MSPDFLLFLPCLMSIVVGMPMMSLMDMGDDYFDETIANFLAADFDKRRVRRDPEMESVDMDDQPLNRVTREADLGNFGDFPPVDQQTDHGCPEMFSSADAFPWPASAGAFPWSASAGAFPWPTFSQAQTIDGGIGQDFGGIGQGIGGIGHNIGAIGHNYEGIGQNVGGIGHSAGGIGLSAEGIGFDGESTAKEPIAYVTTIPYIAGYKMMPIISEKRVIVRDAMHGGARNAEAAPTVEIWSPPTGARSSDFQVGNVPKHPLDLNIFFGQRSAENPDECERGYFDEGNSGEVHTDAEISDGIPYPEAISRLQQRIQHLQSLQLARERQNRSDYENYV